MAQYRKPTAFKMREKTLASLIAQFIVIQYRDVIHRFDVGADIKLTMGQAVYVKESLKHERGFPDLMIFEMKGGYGGLFIELKRDRDEVFTKAGEYRMDKHNIEQREFHIKLRKKGYRAEYGFGFDDTVQKIRAYMILDD